MKDSLFTFIDSKSFQNKAGMDRDKNDLNGQSLDSWYFTVMKSSREYNQSLIETHKIDCDMVNVYQKGYFKEDNSQIQYWECIGTDDTQAKK